MLRFILAIMIIAVIFKVSQDNLYVGFGIYMFMAVAFMIYTINAVECDDVEYQRKMLRTKEGRKKYYYIINSQ